MLNIFCFIVSRRLVVIDDLELTGKKQHKSEHPFLPFGEIPFVSWLLNNVAYRVFLSQNTMSHFSTDFMDNIKRALNQLYDRDKRLNLHGENFWVVEKQIQFEGEEKTPEELVHMISHTHLVNVPHTIPFVLRAKIFQFLLLQQRVEYGG